MGNGSRIRDSIDIMWQELLKPEWCPHLDSWFCTRFSCLGCAHPTPPPPPNRLITTILFLVGDGPLHGGRGDYILLCVRLFFLMPWLSRDEPMIPWTWELVWMILVTDPLCVLDQPTCHVPVLHPSPTIQAKVAFFSKNQQLDFLPRPLLVLMPFFDWKIQKFALHLKFDNTFYLSASILAVISSYIFHYLDIKIFTSLVGHFYNLMKQNLDQS